MKCSAWFYASVMRKLALLVLLSLPLSGASPSAAMTIEFTFADTEFIGITSSTHYPNWAQTAYDLAGQGFDASVGDAMDTWTYSAEGFVAAAQAAGLSPSPGGSLYFFTIPRSPTAYDLVKLEFSAGEWVWNNYQDNANTGANTFDQDEFVVASAPPSSIPEPTTGLLLGLGLLGVAVRRRV